LRKGQWEDQNEAKREKRAIRRKGPRRHTSRNTASKSRWGGIKGDQNLNHLVSKWTKKMGTTQARREERGEKNEKKAQPRGDTEPR